MKNTLLAAAVLFWGTASAQYNQVLLHKNASGQALIDSLVINYKPQVVLEYNNARDTMFSKIYRTAEDSIHCVYSGHTLYLTPGVDPSTAMYSNGSGNGINTEHTFPQSKGAKYGNAKSDLHHLFPVRTAVNSARNNHPYASIPSNEVEKWYINDASLNEPIAANGMHSKLDTNLFVFEPKDAHKGNAARAIFYFYTMYKAEADAADTRFFARMLPYLCEWHIQDPVDSLEWTRTYLKAKYQEGKANPFVLDCSLVQRTYCPTLSADTCSGVGTQVNHLNKLPIASKVYPNPADQSTTISFSLKMSSDIHLELFNIAGQVVYTAVSEGANELVELQIPTNRLANGFYIYKVTYKQGEAFYQLSDRLIIQH
jgi:endonuclease I